jgi:DNA helicase-4
MFAVELMSDSLVNVINIDSAISENVQVQTCTGCKKGVMVMRSGPYSKFLGCSRFPECVHKLKIKK